MMLNIVLSVVGVRQKTNPHNEAADSNCLVQTRFAGE